MLKTISVTYGAKHFHLVAHSNGGNWARTMLLNLHDSHEYGFYSLTTLSTPFSGTVLADYASAGSESWRFRLSNPDGFFGWIKGNNELTRDSQTTFAPGWNRIHHPTVNSTVDFIQDDGSVYSDSPNPIAYYSVSANADADGNWKINGNEGQDRNLMNSSTADLRFQLLAHTVSLSICDVNKETGRCNPGSFGKPQRIVISPNEPGIPNDTVVNVFSSQWPNPLDPANALPSEEFTPITSGGPFWLVNHKTMGNPDLGASVLTAIKASQP